MGYELHACHLLLLGGLFLKEDATVVHLDGSGMFHAAELIAWQYDEAVFFERTRDARVTLHPVQGLRCLVEHLIELCHLVRVAFTVESSHATTIVDCGLLLELAGNKRIEICRQLTHVVAGHGLPTAGHLERRDEYGPEVRLIEAREDGTCHVGHKKGVHIIVVSVQGLIIGDERQFDLVLALGQQLHGNDDVLVLIQDVCGVAFVILIMDIAGAVDLSLKVENDILSHLQIEADDGFPFDRFIGLGGYVESQVIDDLANVCFPVFGQFLGDSFDQHLSLDTLRAQTHGQQKENHDFFHSQLILVCKFN